MQRLFLLRTPAFQRWHLLVFIHSYFTGNWFGGRKGPFTMYDWSTSGGQDAIVLAPNFTQPMRLGAPRINRQRWLHILMLVEVYEGTDASTWKRWCILISRSTVQLRMRCCFVVVKMVCITHVQLKQHSELTCIVELCTTELAF